MTQNRFTPIYPYLTIFILLQTFSLSSKYIKSPQNNHRFALSGSLRN